MSASTRRAGLAPAPGGRNMHVYMLFAHPSQWSFSRSVLEAFTRGLEEAGHSYEIGDLYEMGFRSEMDEAQYLRETSGNPNLPVPPRCRRRAGQDQQGRRAGLHLPGVVERLSREAQGVVRPRPDLRVRIRLRRGRGARHQDERREGARPLFGRPQVEHLEETGIASACAASCCRTGCWASASSRPAWRSSAA